MNDTTWLHVIHLDCGCVEEVVLTQKHPDLEGKRRYCQDCHSWQYVDLVSIEIYDD